MQITFSLLPYYSKEDGYRLLNLLIYGRGSNYIAVYGKLDWDVIQKENLIDDENGDTFVKRDKDYVKGDTDWILLGYHDSCWRDAVRSILWDYRERICLPEKISSGDWTESISYIPSKFKPESISQD